MVHKYNSKNPEFKKRFGISGKSSDEKLNQSASGII